MRLVQYLAVRLLQGILSHLPLPAVRSFARATGRFFAWTGYRRDVVRENIGKAFPELSEDSRRKMSLQSYESIAVTLFEFMLFPSMSPDDLHERVNIVNPEVMQNEIRKGKGLLFLTAHHGSWELFAQAAGVAASTDGRLLMKVQSNAYIAAEVNRWRTHFGLKTTPTSTGVREIVSILQKGGWVVIAADQSASKESIPVPFFGRLVPTFQGPAALALKTGASIVLGVAERAKDDTYRVEFERIPHEDLDRDTGDAIRKLTERHVRATERHIRRAPGQWMWMHRRWKHADAPMDE
jgi:KDO2-lipid IV(A) lauroyltransferase